MAVLRLPAILVAAGLAVAAAPDGPVLRMPSIPEGKLLQKVAPEYPREALRLHIQGTVRLIALIGKDGRMQHLRLIGGHPLLVGAAMAAVKQWICRPTVVDNRPVRVITQVEFHSSLIPTGSLATMRIQRPSRKPATVLR